MAPAWPRWPATLPLSTRERKAAAATAAGRVAIAVGPLDVALPGRVVLAAVPALWSTFLVVTRLLHTLPVALAPPLFNAARLCLAAVVYLPVTLREVRKGRAAAAARKADTAGGAARGHAGAGMDFLVPGVELGLWVTLANAAQIAGLATTSASRAAFLVQLESIFVPLASVALGQAPLSAKMLASTAVTFAGVAVLAGDPIGQVAPAAAATVAAGATAGGGGVGRLLAAVSVGDGLELLAAVFLSIYVLRTNHHVQRVRQATPLVAVKIVTQAVLAVAWVAVRYALPAAWRWWAARAASAGGGAPTAVATATAAAGGGWAVLPAGITGGVVALNVALVVWSGLVVSATTSWMQAAGQRVVPAADTALLFATKPLWATAAAAVVLGETFGRRGVVGGVLVLAGVLAASWNPSATAERGRRGGAGGGGGDTPAIAPSQRG